jgi:cytochrome c556
MKQVSTKVALLAVLLLPLVACSQGAAPGAAGGGAAAAEDDSPEGQAFQFRVGLMHAVAWKVGKLRAMAQGDIPVDEAAAVKHARDTASIAAMMPEGFIPNSAVKGSAALPEIWTNFSDFQQKAKDLENAATALADAAQANGFESAKGMVQPVGQSCGGCHRPYRRREE